MPTPAPKNQDGLDKTKKSAILLTIMTNGGALERREGGEAGRGADARPLTPEPQNYPPQQVIRVTPGEPFSFTPNLDRRRIEALGIEFTSNEIGSCCDAVSLEFEGHPTITGVIEFLQVDDTIDHGDNTPLYPVTGQSEQLQYAILLTFDHVPDGQQISFSITHDDRTADAMMEEFDYSEEEQAGTVSDSSWLNRETGKISPYIAFPEANLSNLQYLIKIEPTLQPMK